MKTCSVKTNAHTCPIYIEKRLLSNQKILLNHVPGHQVMIVTDPQIGLHYLDTLKKNFSHLQCDSIVLPSGEKNKSFKQWQFIFDALIKNHHERSTTLIALGGGLIGDITGFAASCYQRGVNFIQIPTSLLAQVDASIGGKTGLNFQGIKNIIGSFYQPTCIIMDTDTLKTLPDREWRAAISEVIKYALIWDSNFFDWLETHMEHIIQRKEADIEEMIFKCCQIKAEIVSQDEKDHHGLRAVLNLGHTFAHAIESACDFNATLHGEAVGIGLYYAAHFSMQLGWISEKEFDRVALLLKTVQLSRFLEQTPDNETLLKWIQYDKKSNQGTRLVLLKALGKAFLVGPFPLDTIKELLYNVKKQSLHQCPL